MIRNLAATIFRTINSKITKTNSHFLRKILKGSIGISSRMSAVFPYPRNEEVVIGNFDSDIKLVINPSRSMGNAIYWVGFHEVKELIYLATFLKPAMIFFDVGANLGEYTLFAAKRLTAGRVFSVEPLPPMQRILERNIQLNGFTNITLLPYGLSDRPGSLPIYEVKDRHEGLATLFPGSRASQATYEVKLKVLDDELGHFDLARLDFIKIDIEGAELTALKGAAAAIRRFKPVVMVEINKETYHMAGYDSNDVLKFFQSLGYRPFKLNKMAEPEPCPVLPSLGNIIFKPS